MMKKFKDLFISGAYNQQVDFPSVSVTLNNHSLHLKFDSRDVVLSAGYTGFANPWLSSLCFLIEGRTLNEVSLYNWNTWEEAFKEDQTFWDFKQEQEEHFFQPHFELLKAGLDIFRGREYLYQETSPLICRCFGVRESDVVAHLKTNDTATLDSLAGETKAGMGCRSCVPQLKRWLILNEQKKFAHHYKSRPMAEWLLDIDYMLSCFPESAEWKMEIESFKRLQVVVSYAHEAPQKEVEALNIKLQEFMKASVDPEIAFFLHKRKI